MKNSGAFQSPQNQTSMTPFFRRVQTSVQNLNPLNVFKQKVWILGQNLKNLIKFLHNNFT